MAKEAWIKRLAIDPEKGVAVMQMHDEVPTSGGIMAVEKMADPGQAMVDMDGMTTGQPDRVSRATYHALG